MFKEVDDSNTSSNANDYLNQLVDKEIIQLKNNTFPKGLVPLEQLFDHNDVEKNTRVATNDAEVEECNTGTEIQSKIIKLSKNLSFESKERYIHLMKK